MEEIDSWKVEKQNHNCCPNWENILGLSDTIKSMSYLFAGDVLRSKRGELMESKIYEYKNKIMPNSKILSLDIAKSTGYAIYDKGKIDVGKIVLHKNKFEINEVIEHIKTLPKFKDVDVIITEAQGGNMNAHQNGTLKGILLSHLKEDAVIEFVHPATWQSWQRKKLGYKPREKDTKTISVEFANANGMKLEKKQHDEADAYGILQWFLNGGV